MMPAHRVDLEELTHHGRQSSTYNTQVIKLNGGRAEIPLAPGNHTATIPDTKDIVKDKIRAVFWRWSDGNTSHNRSIAVASNTDMDLFALYKYQYYLSVTSSSLVDTYPNGTGWKDAGSEAHYSLNPLFGFFVLQSFDHWLGDMGTSDQNVVDSTLAMDGPKDINAQWKFDYGYLAILIGLITGVGAILSKSDLIAKKIGKRDMTLVAKGTNDNDLVSAK